MGIPSKSSRRETVEWFITWIVGRGLGTAMILTTIYAVFVGSSSAVLPLLASGGTAMWVTGEAVDRLSKMRKGSGGG